MDKHTSDGASACGVHGKRERQQSSGGARRGDMKQACGMLIVGVVLGVVLPAGAAVVTFDDLSGSHVALPAGYQGFTWSTYFWYVDGISYGKGYKPATVSPRNVAFNAYGYDVTVAAVNPFDFDGAYFTGGYKDGLNVDISGWRDGSMVDNTTITVSSTAPMWVGLDWANVDELRFHSYGGTLNPDHGGLETYYHFAMDNFTYTVVPVPSTVLLASIGMTCVGWLRRRRTL